MFSNDLSIDPGTARIPLIYVRDKAHRIECRACCTHIRQDRAGSPKSVAAVGHDAKAQPYARQYRCDPSDERRRLSLTPGDRKCSSTLLNKRTATALCARPRVPVCVPVGATQVERRAIRIRSGAGAREVFFDRRADGGRDRRRSASF